MALTGADLGRRPPASVPVVERGGDAGADDVLDLADRLWRGEVTTTEVHPLRPHPAGLAEVADGVAFVPSFANVSAIATDDGLVLVDTGSAFVATEVHETLRRWSPSRLNTAIYSHGHIDHVFGVPVWAAESAGQGWPEPVVVAHEALPARFDRYILTAGYNGIINRRQFGIESLEWPTEYRYPDRTYRDRLDLDVGGVGAELHHARGETDDHTWTWFPGRRVLCCGDLFIWASPNAGNPQKVQRYPREWADALRRMLALYDAPGGGPEVLLPGHGYPVVGEDRVRQALGDTAELLESLVGQTLALMNDGARLDEVIHTVTPPPRADGAAVPATRLRRARVRGPDRLAPVRRMVGRQPRHPQTGSRAGPRPRAGRAGRGGGHPGRPGPGPGRRDGWAPRPDRRPRPDGPARVRRRPAPGRASGRAGLAGRAGRPRRSGGTPARLHPPRRAATSTMAHGVFSWAARESGPGPEGVLNAAAPGCPSALLNRTFGMRRRSRRI